MSQKGSFVFARRENSIAQIDNAVDGILDTKRMHMMCKSGCRQVEISPTTCASIQIDFGDEKIDAYNCKPNQWFAVRNRVQSPFLSSIISPSPRIHQCPSWSYTYYMIIGPHQLLRMNSPQNRMQLHVLCITYRKTGAGHKRNVPETACRHLSIHRHL